MRLSEYIQKLQDILDGELRNHGHDPKVVAWMCSAINTKFDGYPDVIEAYETKDPDWLSHGLHGARDGASKKRYVLVGPGN